MSSGSPAGVVGLEPALPEPPVPPGASGASRGVRRRRAVRAAGARPGRLVAGRRLGRRSRRRGGGLGDVQLLEGVAHRAGAVVAGRAAVDLDGRLGHLAGIGLKGGRGQRGLIGGGAAEVHRGRDRRGEQQHGDRPQLALDEVAQYSADGAHPVTSEAVGAGLAAPPALEPEPVDPAAAVAAAPVPAEEGLWSAAVRRYAGATPWALPCGKPPGPATRAKPSMLSSRPSASTCLPSTRTKRWTSPKKRSMSKKVPLKTNEKGRVGNPAEPTVAPGGSVAAAACVAGAGDAAAEAAGVADEPPEEEADGEAEADGLAPPAAALAAGAAAAAGVGPWPPPPETFNEVKSMRAERATDCSW